VLLVGVGGIGSASALYLAAAGVGRIGLVDSDTVELSNLQRQVLFRTHDMDSVKVESAKEAISALNPYCVVETYHTRLGHAMKLRDILKDYGAVIDGSDNFCTRFLVADCSWIEGVPLISASALGFQGQLLVVIPSPGNSCYRCLIPEPRPDHRMATCRQAGILGGVVGVMGSLAAVETLKLFLGHDRDMAHRFLAYDGLRCRFVEGERVRDPDCELCGELSTSIDPVEEDSVHFAGRHGIGAFLESEGREASRTCVGTGR
jgi:adenylyltransferase/sulfurtransferase